MLSGDANTHELSKEVAQGIRESPWKKRRGLSVGMSLQQEETKKQRGWTLQTRGRETGNQLLHPAGFSALFVENLKVFAA